MPNREKLRQLPWLIVHQVSVRCSVLAHYLGYSAEATRPRVQVHLAQVSRVLSLQVYCAEALSAMDRLALAALGASLLRMCSVESDCCLESWHVASAALRCSRG